MKKSFSSPPPPLSLINREEEKIDISRPWMRFFPLFFRETHVCFCLNKYLVAVLVLLPLCDAVLLGDILALWHHLGVLNGVHALSALLAKVILADLKLKIRDQTTTFP